MVMKRTAGAGYATMIAVLALTACWAPGVWAFDGGDLRTASVDGALAESAFPIECLPDASAKALASALRHPFDDASHFVTLTTEELSSIAGMGAMSAALGTSMAGVVLWDERPQPPSVSIVNTSDGYGNSQAVSVTILGQ